MPVLYKVCYKQYIESELSLKLILRTGLDYERAYQIAKPIADALCLKDCSRSKEDGRLYGWLTVMPTDNDEYVTIEEHK
ncbi:hypothetical protein [Robertmurraya sp.]|uniref:hypothetical protein n=1 Tax=Robertmurraya sp. TaxID=2837525 RepID=UPI003703CBF8